MRGQRRGVVVWCAAAGIGLVVVVGAVVYVRLLAPSRTGAAVVAPRVDVVGDSLVRQASGSLKEVVGAAGYDVRVDATPGEGLGGSTVMTGIDLISRPPGDVLVLATSANDAVRLFEGAKPEAPATAGVRRYRELLDGVARLVPARCVVVVNAREKTSAFYYPERARALNAELRTLAPGYQNMVLVDWAAASEALPTAWFAADQMHFGDDPTVVVTGSPGAKAYAEALLAGVRRCKPPVPADAG